MNETSNPSDAFKHGMTLYVKILSIIENENARFNYDDRCAIMMSLGRSFLFRGLRHLKEAYGNDAMLGNFEEILKLFHQELKLIIEMPEKK